MKRRNPRIQLIACVTVLAAGAALTAEAGSTHLAQRSTTERTQAVVGTHTVNKVELIDACEINDIFCSEDGTSDIPDFLSAYAVFNANVHQGDAAMLTLVVRGSVPNESHKVILCPGEISNDWGFTGCRLVGTFTTNVNGNGTIHMNFPDGVPAERHLNVNTPAFATVLATCPDAANSFCAEPQPLH